MATEYESACAKYIDMPLTLPRHRFTFTPKHFLIISSPINTLAPRAYCVAYCYLFSRDLISTIAKT